MRVHVELRYDGDRFIARYRPQRGYTGWLAFSNKGTSSDQKPCLTVVCEPRPGYPNERQPGPELYDVQLIDVFGDEIQLRGRQCCPDGQWRKQEWDVIVLADPHRSTFPRAYA